MKISLLDSGPSIWYLGKPGNIKASLNFCNRGPIELNFSELDSEDQKKLLFDIKNDFIKSSETFECLYKIWSKNEPKVQITSEVNSYLKHKKNLKEQKKILKTKIDLEKREKIFNQKIDLLSRRSINALKSFFKDTKDLRLARSLKEKELKRKRPRVSVIDFLNEYIKKIEYQVSKNINNNNGSNINIIPKETIEYSVVESDIQEIKLNQDQLQQFAAGNPLVVDDT